MWAGVTKRFNEFASNLKLTDDQIDDARTKYRGITRCLNQHYYDQDSDSDHRMLVGSWGKYTRMRPPRDVDLMFSLPKSVYDRFQENAGNKQSALLQEVKNVISKDYPSTEMRADGQVVIVRFNTLNVEVVPAFELTTGQYWICDTNGGGSYKATDPVAEQTKISDANGRTNGNARRLIKYLKAWQRECSVPLKSFWLELLAISFLDDWQYRANSVFYHDWMSRDFFAHLMKKSNSYIIVPGTDELVNIGNEWATKAESAHSRAEKAERLEYIDDIAKAGEEWQKIFGSQIPKTL